MVNSQEKKEILLNSYRMFGLKDDEGGVNRTQGLFMLCDDIIKPDFVVAESGDVNTFFLIHAERKDVDKVLLEHNPTQK